MRLQFSMDLLFRLSCINLLSKFASQYNYNTEKSLSNNTVKFCLTFTKNSIGLILISQLIFTGKIRTDNFYESLYYE